MFRCSSHAALPVPLLSLARVTVATAPLFTSLSFHQGALQSFFNSYRQLLASPKGRICDATPMSRLMAWRQHALHYGIHSDHSPSAGLRCPREALTFLHWNFGALLMCRGAIL